VIKYFEWLAKKGRGDDPIDSVPRTVKTVAVPPNPNMALKANSGRLVKPDADGIYWLTENEAQGIRFMPNMKTIT